ncbi:hypothetical protein GCM10009680_62400 [Streptomyces yatensis]|uniref:Uncharacterized protein n=1 Tax=Streptomyces yatensis TaxID=155177 RepID=A0ABN2IW92_9ACTN
MEMCPRPLWTGQGRETIADKSGIACLTRGGRASAHSAANASNSPRSGSGARPDRGRCETAHRAGAPSGRAAGPRTGPEKPPPTRRDTRGTAADGNGVPPCRAATGSGHREPGRRGVPVNAG